MALPIPQSLYNPDAATAAERRVLAGISADNGAPSGDVGFHTRNHKWLHVVAESVGAGASFDVTLYVRSKFSGTWAKALWFGTSGTLSITTAGSPSYAEPVLIAGIDEAYLHASNFAGGGTANAWLAGSTPDGG